MPVPNSVPRFLTLISKVISLLHLSGGALIVATSSLLITFGKSPNSKLAVSFVCEIEKFWMAEVEGSHPTFESNFAV